VALSRGTELLAFHSALHPFSHASALLPAIDLLLEGQRAGVADLAGLGVCIGPGSFTGLRVGMTTAKAIGASKNLPAAPVSSTVLLAAGSGASGFVAPVVDARRGEVYSSLYRMEPGAAAATSLSEGGLGPDARGIGPEPQEDPVEVLPPEAGSPEAALHRILEACPGPVTLVGSACVTYEALFREMGAGRVVLASRSRCAISPEVLARVCGLRLASGSTVAIGQLEPLYVGRPPIHGKQ
jgi:tRNA threonylcarbamoyl adenosine modification protein YeaZ